MCVCVGWGGPHSSSQGGRTDGRRTLQQQSPPEWGQKNKRKVGFTHRSAAAAAGCKCCAELTRGAA